MEIKNYFAQDAQGNIMPSANCYLYLPGTTTLATGLVDGSGTPISNPFLASSVGQVTFGAPNGVYDLRIAQGARDFTIEIQCADLLQALNETASFLGAKSSAPTTRNDGSVLRIADRYFNTSDQLEYLYKATGWVANNLDGQLLATSQGASLLGAIMQDGSIGTIQQAIDDGDNRLRQELADPSNTLVKHQRTSLAIAVDHSIAKTLSQLSVDLWDFSGLVTSRPVPEAFGSWDWTPAFEAARVAMSALGGGVLTFGAPGVYQASEIRKVRFIFFDGGGAGRVELKQIGGSNRDFLKSENFDALTGTGATVSSSDLVPSWFGLKDIRVNGNRYNATTNPTGNTSGRAIAWYGPAMIMQGNVLVYGAAENNIYTEYSNISGSTGWQGQEEGQFDNVFSRDSGGHGWVFRGPHNSRLNSYIGGFNDGYGFRSESGPNYDGGFDWIGSIHTYANGRGASPAADTGIYIGEIARIGAMINDGDNAIIAGSNVQIGKWRGYNVGGQGDGLDLQGNAIQIESANVVVWANSVGRKAIKSSGARNKIVVLDLVTNNPDNDAIAVTGSGLQILGGYVQGFSGAGRTGLDLAGTKHNINLEITGCATAFNYTAGNNNRVDLEINTSAGQVAVAGSAPGATDRMTIRSGGATAKGMKAAIQSSALPMDVVTLQTVMIAHGLLYTPSRQSIDPNWITSSPDSSAFAFAFEGQVVSTDDTNIVIRYKLSTAAPAGTLGRLAIRVDLT